MAAKNDFYVNIVSTVWAINPYTIQGIFYFSANFLIMLERLSPATAQAQLEQLIEKLVNAWLSQQGGNTTHTERIEIVKRFSNLKPAYCI